MSNKKKKIGALDKYIIFSFACIILYTITEHWILVKTGMTLDHLSTLFYGVFGGEVLICALIKKLKLKQEKKPGDEDKEEAEHEPVG